jgi:type VI secretion system protein ImpA
MQAKLLIGKSLIEAIEALLPENASQTKIDFGPETGFVLHMDRLKMLAAEAASLVKPVESEDPGPAPEIATRAEVSGHIKGVEEFFRVREPASPIPLLLFRARTYLDRDFGSIVSELIPAKPPA